MLKTSAVARSKKVILLSGPASYHILFVEVVVVRDDFVSHSKLSESVFLDIGFCSSLICCEVLPIEAN